MDIINALHTFFQESLPEYTVKMGLSSGPWKCQDTEYIPYGENGPFLLFYDGNEYQSNRWQTRPCYRVHIGGSTAFLSLIEHHESAHGRKITLLTKVPLEDPKCFDILLENICQEKQPPKTTSTPSANVSEKNSPPTTSSMSPPTTLLLSTPVIL